MSINNVQVFDKKKGSACFNLTQADKDDRGKFNVQNVRYWPSVFLHTGLAHSTRSVRTKNLAS